MRSVAVKREDIVSSADIRLAVGGIAETQACLDFCAKHNIKSNIELIPIDYINTAYERVLKQDIRGRCELLQALFVF